MRGIIILLAICGLAVSSEQIRASSQSNNLIRKDVYTFGKYVIDLNIMKARISGNNSSIIQDCSTSDFACLKIQEADGLNGSFIVPWKCGSYSVGTVWHQNNNITKIYAKSVIFKGGFPYTSYVISNKNESIFYLYSPDFGIVGVASKSNNFIQKVLDANKNNSIENIFSAISTFNKFVECKK